MASMARAQGYHAEDVTEPSAIIPALRRALEANAKRQPAFLELSARSIRSMGAGCATPGLAISTTAWNVPHLAGGVRGIGRNVG